MELSVDVKTNKIVFPEIKGKEFKKSGLSQNEYSDLFKMLSEVRSDTSERVKLRFNGYTTIYTYYSWNCLTLSGFRCLDGQICHPDHLDL